MLGEGLEEEPGLVLHKEHPLWASAAASLSLPPGEELQVLPAPGGAPALHLLPLACGQPRGPEVGVSRQVSPSASMCGALVTSLETQASEAGGGAAASQDQEGVVQGSRGRLAWEGARGWDTAGTLSTDLGGRDIAVSYQ